MSSPAQKKFKKPKNRRNKINLVFDEEKRKDFLTGFHKRKLQRKKVAHEKLEEQLKAERKRLKQEAKESYKKLVVSNRDIPGLEHLLEDQYEDEDVTVRITELSTDTIAKQNNWIGSNVPKYENDESEEEESEGEEEKDSLPGMELKVKKKVKKEKEEKPEFKTHKEIKKTLKKQATKNVQKSTVFQRKNKIERQKQKKKSLQKKMEKDRINKKMNKKRGGRGRKEMQE